MSEVPKTSRAACVVTYKEPLEIREVPIPDEIEPGAILVKTEAASICGSDVHLWQGELGIASRIPLPIILGHEMMGRVVRMGPASKPILPDNPCRRGIASCGRMGRVASVTCVR